MKKIALIALVCIGICSLSAQTNNAITVFTEGGEKFFLILNGVKQNEIAETNVKATGINGQQVKAKVIFAAGNIPDCDKSIPMMWEGNSVSNTEFTFSVSKDRKGNYKWKFVSQAPVTGGQVANNNTATNTNISPATNTVVSGNTNTNTNTNNTNSNTTVTTTSTTNTTTGGNAGAGISINVGENGMNVNMNVHDGTTTGNNVNTTTTTTTTSTSYTTSTTTHSSGTQVENNTGNGNGSVSISVNAPANTTTNTTTTTTTTTSANTVNSDACSFPMTAGEFTDAKSSVESKSFEDTKLTLAKQVADNNCMSAEQIKGIMSLFSFEETKLEYAKYCYSRCSDKKNYYKLNDAFTFESSTEELNEYIKGKK